jgi:hypothetical protein
MYRLNSFLSFLFLALGPLLASSLYGSENYGAQVTLATADPGAAHQWVLSRQTQSFDHPAQIHDQGINWLDAGLPGSLDLDQMTRLSLDFEEAGSTQRGWDLKNLTWGIDSIGFSASTGDVSFDFYEAQAGTNQVDVLTLTALFGGDAVLDGQTLIEVGYQFYSADNRLTNGLPEDGYPLLLGAYQPLADFYFTFEDDTSDASYSDYWGATGVSLTQVPEPSATGLAAGLLGILGLVGLLRRRPHL